ncbi:MAG: septum formation initiator family protein [Lachnospiraceae bacterium]|nr:septum formation initiator family protein [Ruminococcus sp.]MCM1274088.1 septum formation initiator family protein [Lachnospiraceae bacterium]
MSLKPGLQEARENKKRHGLVRFLAGAAVLVAAVYVAYSIISDKIAINRNMERYEQLVAETNAVKARSEQIDGYLKSNESLDEYIEEIARDKLDFANADERIYYVVPSAGD